MVAKMSFRNHLLLLLFLDILMIMLIGIGSGESTMIDPGTSNNDSSFLVDFVLKPTLSTSGGMFFVVLTLFIAVSAIGVTSGSNFAGVSGVLSSGMGVLTGGAIKLLQSGVIVAVISDYFLVYNFMSGGATFGFMRIIATIIFLPLIVDAVWSSVDWMRGVNT